MVSTFLGLDLGEKRVGIAIADDVMKIATPVKTFEFKHRNQVVEELRKIISENQVAKIIVGLPKTLKGDCGPAAEKVIAQVDWLKCQIDLPWIFWDERLSTQEVERVLVDADVSRSKRKEVRDGLAAQRILQNYIDFQKIS